MCTKWLVLVMMAFTPNISFAEDFYRLLNTETSVSDVDLLGEDLSDIAATVVYPGRLSGLCGIQLKLDSKSVKIQDVLKLLKVTAPFPQPWKPHDRFQIPDDRTLFVKLYPEHEAYMAFLRVTSLDGRSISETLRQAYPNGELQGAVVSGVSCSER